MKPDPARIIIIQVDSGFVSDKYLKPFGIRDGKECTIFSGFDWRVLEKVQVGNRQLVLTSHTPPTGSNWGSRGDTSAFHVAEQIKDINPEAIVFAFTGSKINPGQLNGTRLDGVIHKSGLAISFPATLCRAFLDGASNQDILQMVLGVAAT